MDPLNFPTMTRLALLCLALAAQAAEPAKAPELSNCPPMPPGTPPPVVVAAPAPADTPRIPAPDQALFATAMRIESAFGRGEAAGRWAAILPEAPGEAQRATAFLLATMPTRDLRRLDPAFVKENVDLALTARREFPWAKDVPEALFLNDVLPYAALDEDRDPWRAQFLAMLRPVVAGCKTRREAILAVNAALRDLVKVDYNTKRRAPNQSPADSMRQGMASCSGLSILLVDAFRAVGIPARIAGCATWVTVQGNHNWVEVWDGEWHFTEYYPDKGGLNRSWFLERAAYADPDRPETRIYATSWAPTGQAFPIIWDLRQRVVAGIDRTAAYHAWAGGRKRALAPDESLVGVRVFRGDRRQASAATLSQGGKEIATVRTAGPEQDMADVPWTRVRLADGPVTVTAGGKSEVVEPKGGGETVVDLRLAP